MKPVKFLAGQLADRLLRVKFICSAVTEQADLDAFKGKPSLPLVIGVSIIIISSLMGWPAVAAMGVVSVRMNQPWIAVIGAPLVYGISHLLFMVGIWLSGGKYSLIFLRWLSRVSVEKLQTYSTFGE